MQKLGYMLLLGVCAGAHAQESVTALELGGRFSELERVAEARFAAAAEPAVAVLAPLCIAYSKLKKYAKLFPCLESLDRRIASGDTVIVTDRPLISNSDGTALASTLRAQAYVEVGEYQKAVSEARTALERVPDRMSAGMWPPTKYRLLNRAVIPLAYAMAGDRDNALRELKLLEDFSYGFMGNAAWRPLKAYSTARVHMALGDYKAALPFVERDDWFPWMNDPTWGLKSGDSAETAYLLPRLMMRGKCQLETGNLAAAHQTLERVLKHPRIHEFGELYWIALYEAGRAADLQKSAERAIDLYRRSVDVIEMQRASINTEANKIGFVGDKQQVYGRLVAALAENGRAAEAFEYVERSKARALVDLLASRKELSIPAMDAGRARDLLAQLDAADRASREIDLSPAASPSTALRNLQAARAELRQAAPEASSLVSVASIPPEELRRLLGADETLVEYYYVDGASYAFVLALDELRIVRIDAAGLVQEVQAFRQALEAHASAAWRTNARALHHRLWAPVRDFVVTPKVLLVAHGALHYLPFGALEDADGRMLIDRHALRFLPSASVLKYLRAPLERKDGLLLALGNPDLQDPGMDLKFAEAEARAVAELNPGARILVRKEASETNFKKAGSVFSRVHFATHGKFQADDPLSSGLYLAKDVENDGVLTVGELYSMTLDADLVTLSACETGLGKIGNGDDVVGLTRGFLFAGSRSVVASLWSVEDRATAELMKAFYENLGRMPKRDALRAAQLKTRETFAHPFFWAAFQLTGRGD